MTSLNISLEEADEPLKDHINYIIDGAKQSSNSKWDYQQVKLYREERVSSIQQNEQNNNGNCANNRVQSKLHLFSFKILLLSYDKI